MPSGWCSATECTSVPTDWARVPPAFAPTWYSTQSSGLRRAVSTREGESATTSCFGSTSAASVDSGSRPHQRRGSATVTPSSARAARPAAAAARGVAPSAASASSPASRTRRSRPTSAGAVIGSGTAVSRRTPAASRASAGSRSGGSTRSRKSEGPSSGERTAVATTWRRARETAAASMRSSSWRTSRSRVRWSVGHGASAGRVTRSTRSVAPSSWPRSRVFGHTPSCRPTTITVSHSWPAAAAGVRTCTASPDSARRARVSTGRSWDSM